MKPLFCKDVRRREQVRQHQELNGLDYLEVGPDHVTLNVYFLGKAPVQLNADNVLIEGGQRVRDLKVQSVEVVRRKQVEFDDTLTVVVNKAGDFSTYTLRVVERDEEGRYRRHRQFDPLYDRIDFNFNSDCPNELDCKQAVHCPPEPRETPDINYLAKDYASFRKLMLDRLAFLMPEWQERHVPDIGVALVEVLAYAGDHLSYYQDAVGTEAYLDTARRRISVRRHARLVDYPMHEGCNARTWLCLRVATDLPEITPESIYFITRLSDDPSLLGGTVTEEELSRYRADGYQVFEPVEEKAIRLYADHNRIHFYTWNDRQCCLARGATRATLVGQWVPPEEVEAPVCDPVPAASETSAEAASGDDDAASGDDDAAPKLHLRPGDVLIFEEVVGPETGHPQDADPRHRHAVRLTEIEGDTDPLTGRAIVHITWAEQDALPFPLCLTALGPAPECKLIEPISVACGNVVLVDHGRTDTLEWPDPVPPVDVSDCCKGEGIPAARIDDAGRFEPVLPAAPLTFSEPFTAERPAVSALVQDVRKALPQIALSGRRGDDEPQTWWPQPDLLSSRADDRHFVAEIDDEGRAYIRFGNDEIGKKPEAGTKFEARYRIGNGKAGNVGAEAIVHAVFRNLTLEGIKSVRNPLAAQGGTNPEPLTEVRLFAPGAFRKTLRRAVVADDYAAVVLSEFEDQVQNAAAKLRWNGSWYEVLVAIDAFGREQADQALLDQISACLHRYRRIGHDLSVRSALRVPLEIELLICVQPNFLKGHVRAELLQVFSNKKLADGRLGFFHPDKLSFGDAVYLSKIVAAAQSVQGVESVIPVKFQRWCKAPNAELETGVLALSPFEIARLDNDPSFPENGVMTLTMRGGR